MLYGPAVKRYSEDMNDILSQKAGQYAIKYIRDDTRGQPVHSEKSSQVGVTLSPNVRRKARQAQNSPILQVKQLRRSGLFLKSYLYESYSMIHTVWIVQYYSYSMKYGCSRLIYCGNFERAKYCWQSNHDLHCNRIGNSDFALCVSQTYILAFFWILFSCIKFGSFFWMCDLISRRFGNSAGEKYGVRVSWTFFSISRSFEGWCDFQL